MRYIYFGAGFSPYKQHQQFGLMKTSQEMIFVSQDLRDKPIVQKLSLLWYALDCNAYGFTRSPNCRNTDQKQHFVNSSL